MEIVERHELPRVTLTLWREISFPFGCKRVWRASLESAGLGEREKLAHSRKTCLAWLAKAAQLFGCDESDFSKGSKP